MGEIITRPHTVLARHYNEQEGKQPFLRNLFDAAAPHYEKIASWGFLGTGDWYRREALRRAGLKPQMQVIDIATGTGPTTRAAAQVTGSSKGFLCIEPSAGMLKEARNRMPCGYVRGCADALPVRDAQFDFLCMGFALRHVESLADTFAEYARVLKPGGKLLIMDITRPQNEWGDKLCMLYFRELMPRLTRLITGDESATHLMEYYWETLERMVPPESVLKTLRDVGLLAVKRHVEVGIFSEYTATKPQHPGGRDV